MDLRSLEVGKEHLSSIEKNRDYNLRILQFYETMKSEIEDSSGSGLGLQRVQKIESKMERMDQCNSLFQLDFYQQSQVKDFLRTNLCKDKFCNNCKKVKQASRMARFIPEIDKYKDKGLFHLVLTSPNVGADDLKDEIKNQFKAFARLIDFFKGKSKIVGIDLESMGYLGAIRSLEVTYKEDSYHPHLHVLIVCDGLDLGEKRHMNVYSSNYRTGKTRLFTDLEVLVQKIWYLLLNGQRVTKKNIEALEQGYSSIIDEFQEDDYFELFKYMTKSNSDGDFMTYRNFKTLYTALHSVRQIQGYGVLFRLKDKDISEEVDELYNSIIERLKAIEDGKRIYQSPGDLLNDDENLLISRKKIHAYIRKIDKKNQLNEKN